MEAIKQKDLVIGIDPDLEKSGIAITGHQRILTLIALPFSQVVALIESYPDAVFVVEDVEYNKPVFNRHLPVRANLKVAQNVGMVKAVARLIINTLTEKDRRFVKVPPLRGRFKQAKKDRAYFNRLTGWEAVCNEDMRDAALLALYGRCNPQALVLRPSEVPH